MTKEYEGRVTVECREDIGRGVFEGFGILGYRKWCKFGPEDVFLCLALDVERILTGVYDVEEVFLCLVLELG
jgi:hypothetical protein